MVRYRFMVTFALLVVLVAAGCGSETQDQQVLRAGDVDVRLPDGWRVTQAGAERPAGASKTAKASPAAGQPADTVPLAKEDPSSAFFGASQRFQQCLKDRGATFRGAPDPSNPDSPTNDPSYVKDLSTCASKSGIVQALQEMQKSQKTQSPADIEKQNKGFLRWRTCMIGKGWKISEPKPDAEGRLFSFGGGSGPQITPPAGKTIGDADMQQCAKEAG
jgi:hypothetical protein